LYNIELSAEVDDATKFNQSEIAGTTPISLPLEKSKKIKELIHLRPSFRKNRGF